MAEEDKDKIWEYVLLGMNDWPRGGVTLTNDPTSRQIFLSWPGGAHVFRGEELDAFPKRVSGLDWKSFAATLRVQMWVARAMYKREEPGSGEPEQIHKKGQGYEWL